MKSEEISTWIETLHLDKTVLSADPLESIRAPVGAEESLPELPALGLGDLIFGEKLGEGGMGFVRVARQTSLARSVAVKTLRHERRDEASARALVREAVVTGSLEHPHVVPVHLLGRDEHGDPVLVMKRVEGVSWAVMLGDRAHPAWERAGADRLDWNLRVLMQVASALELAHTRGIVHRDLKPANVMIGGHGETYVVDWGLALDVEEAARRGDERAPIVGTPAYLAPEMLLGDDRKVRPATDVYMLGGILHELLTGRPRHSGASLQETLFAAHESRPIDYEPSVPAGLAAIANRATSADPEARYRDAEEFRRAIRRFLEERTAIALAENARERLEALEKLLTGALDPTAVHRLFGECTFGFREALRISPELLDARECLARALTVMAEHELASQNPRAALAILSELDPPRADLTARAHALLADLESREKELAALRGLRSDLDVRTGSKSRAFILLGIVVVFALAAKLAQYYLPSVVSTDATIADGTVLLRGAFFIALVLGLLAGRKLLFRNKASLRLALAGLVGAGALFLSRIAGRKLGISVEDALHNDLMLLATCAATAAVTLDRRLISVGVWLAGSSLVLAWVGGPGYLIYGFALLIALMILALAWLSGDQVELL